MSRLRSVLLIIVVGMSGCQLQAATRLSGVVRRSLGALAVRSARTIAGSGVVRSQHALHTPVLSCMRTAPGTTRLLCQQVERFSNAQRQELTFVDLRQLPLAQRELLGHGIQRISQFYPVELDQDDACEHCLAWVRALDKESARELKMVAALREGKVGGFYVTTYTPSSREGIIVQLAVDPQHQKCGYGRALLRHAMHDLQQRDCTHITLSVTLKVLMQEGALSGTCKVAKHLDAMPTIKLYLSEGFQAEGKPDIAFNNRLTLDQAFMHKDLVHWRA